MSQVLVSKSVAKGLQVQQAASQLQLDVDRLYALSQVINSVKQETKEFEALKKKLAAVAAESTDEGEVVLQGVNHRVIFSAPTKETVPPDMQVYADTVEADVFVATTKISITDARKYLPLKQFEELFSEKLGSRKFVRVE